MNDVPVIQVVGYKNSGKTSLICALLQSFQTKGLRVGVIKHDAHDFECDPAETDTWKHRRAGAIATLITSPIASAHWQASPMTCSECVDAMISKDQHDLILVEGFKEEAYPKIVCIRDLADVVLLTKSNIIGVGYLDTMPDEQVVRLQDELQQQGIEPAQPLADLEKWIERIRQQIETESSNPLRAPWNQRLQPSNLQSAPTPLPNFLVTTAPLAPEQLRQKVEHEAAGAVVLFCGTVREWTKGKRTLKLFYEAYVPMAVRQLQVIAEEIDQRWPGAVTAIHHRIGELAIGELAVVIATSSAHRRAAYEANEYAIERIKQIVPIWKKEFWEDGTSWIGDQLEQQSYPQGAPHIKGQADQGEEVNHG